MDLGNEVEPQEAIQTGERKDPGQLRNVESVTVDRTISITYTSGCIPLYISYITMYIHTYIILNI